MLEFADEEEEEDVDEVDDDDVVEVDADGDPVYPKRK